MLYDLYHLAVDFVLVIVYFLNRLFSFISSFLNVFKSFLIIITDFIKNINLDTPAKNLGFSLPSFSGDFSVYFIAFILLSIFIIGIKKIIKA